MAYVALDVDVDLTRDQILSVEDRNKLDKMLKIKKGVVAVVGAGTLITSAAGLQLGDKEEVAIEKVKEVKEAKKEEVAEKEVKKQETKVAAEIVYSAEKEYGKELTTESGKQAVATLTKTEDKEIKNSILRPVSSKSVTKMEAPGVVKTDKKEEFNPFTTYVTTKGTQSFAPANGNVVDVSKDQIVIKYTNKDVPYYLVLQGVSPSVKNGDKVTRGALIGTTTGTEMKFAIAKKYDKGEYYEYIHPNRFVDAGNSDTYKYGSYEYYTKSNVQIDDKVKGTAVEEAFNKIPDKIKESDVLKGVVIENKEQLSLLTSKEVVYSDEVESMALIQNGTATVSPQVRALEPLIKQNLAIYGLESLTEFMLALLQQESGGDESVLANDPFQSSESLGLAPGALKDPNKSIAQGIKHFITVLKLNKSFSESGYGDIRLAIHSYNFGGRVSTIADKKDLGYSIKYMQEMSAELAKEYGMKQNVNWRGEYSYGDFTYVAKVFNYFTPNKDWKAQKVDQIKDSATLTGKVKEKTETREEKSERLYKEYDQQLQDVKASYAKYVVKMNKGSLKGKTIVIDAGHGNSDKGTISVDKEGTSEASLNLQYALELKAKLESLGAKVILTRSTADGFLAPADRGYFANNQNADLLISLHNNAFKDNSVSAHEVHYKPTGNADNSKLAQIMDKQLDQSLGFIQDRNVKERNDLAILNTSKVPSILFEFVYLSNPVGVEAVKNAGVRESILNSVANGVLEYMGVEIEIPKEEVKEEPKKETKEEVKKEETTKEEKVEEVKEEPAKEEPVKEETKVEEKEEKSETEVEDKEVEKTVEETVEETKVEEEKVEEQPKEEVKEEETKTEEVKETPEEEKKEEAQGILSKISEEAKGFLWSE